MGKALLALGGGLTVIVVLVLVIAAGIVGTAQAQPPPGGCTVTPSLGTPSAAGAPSANTPGAPQLYPTLDADQMKAASTVVGVAKGMNVQERGAVIALATAYRESSLNPVATKGDAKGLFQQQGEAYADVQRDDPVASSAAFYRYLLQDVPQYADPNAISIHDAAYAVHKPLHGAAIYAPFEQWATMLGHQLFTGAPPVGSPPGRPGGVACRNGGGSGPIKVLVQGTRVSLPPESGYSGVLDFPTPQAATAAAAGLSYLGTPYAWGGGDANGPTKGTTDNGGPADQHRDFDKIGFDCAGLTVYAYAQAQIGLSRPAGNQLTNARTVLPYSQVQPGDLLFWGDPANAHHVALYLGKLGTVIAAPLMLEAPNSGEVVRVAPVRTGGDFIPEVARPS